jgi:hypothetical protein
VTLPLSYSRLRAATSPRRFGAQARCRALALRRARPPRSRLGPSARPARRRQARDAFHIRLEHPEQTCPAQRWLASRSSRSAFALRATADNLRIPAGSPTVARSRVSRAQVGGEGRTRTFEATRATDLQSAAFDRSATSPVVCVGFVDVDACPADRTIFSLVSRPPGARELARPHSGMIPMELAKGLEPPTC